MLEKLENMILQAPINRIEGLRKDIEKYKENVNKCNIFQIDSLSYNIGGNINFLRFVSKLPESKLTDDQKRQVEKLETEYKTISNKVLQCQCVKKLKRH